jgi:hypothetical protein
LKQLLKDKSAGKDELVVIGVKLGGRNLHARAGRKAKATLFIVGTKLEFAERNPRG